LPVPWSATGKGVFTTVTGAEPAAVVVAGSGLVNATTMPTPTIRAAAPKRVALRFILILLVPAFNSARLHLPLRKNRAGGVTRGRIPEESGHTTPRAGRGPAGGLRLLAAQAEQVQQ